MTDMLPYKVKFANLHLNQLLISSGKVTPMDINSVVTSAMRETGRLILISEEELASLERGDPFVEFVRIKEAA